LFKVLFFYPVSSTQSSHERENSGKVSPKSYKCKIPAPSLPFPSLNPQISPFLTLTLRYNPLPPPPPSFISCLLFFSPFFLLPLPFYMGVIFVETKRSKAVMKR